MPLVRRKGGGAHGGWRWLTGDLGTPTPAKE